ncbi:MAG: cupin domain-containing protein [Actinobacteria bacterium]|nr:cupin domain-containing protein [Actinomycetota bacterium]
MVVAAEDRSIALLPGKGKTVSWPGHQVTFVHGYPGAAYSLIEWAVAPGVPSPPLHVHRMTDESFYVLEGTFGFQVGERTVDGASGAFFFVPKGIGHTFWNRGPTPAKVLVTMSPAGFERYFEELAEGLSSAGNTAAAALDIRRALSGKHDIEIVGPPRQAAD